eukprot:6822060-Pyramimonas_sp.AAC.1
MTTVSHLRPKTVPGAPRREPRPRIVRNTSCPSLSTVTEGRRRGRTGWQGSWLGTESRRGGSADGGVTGKAAGLVG